MTWPATTSVLEVNALVWCGAWSARLGRPVTLADLPADAWDAVTPAGVEAVWLMGVWERSPAGIAIGRADPAMGAAHREALADFDDDDVVGSPYCVRDYVVDAALGGDTALSVARAELARRGCRLVVDFVPNHVAPDHPWVAEHPERFVRGTAEDAATDPAAFLTVGDQHLARGRDPYFAPWPDVVQLDATSPALRDAVVRTLRSIADRADAVRCDMAMLLLSDVFDQTWGRLVGPPPPTEYWADVIGAVRRTHPSFGFLAEAYWDREPQLVELGFDACYDKRLYDRLVAGDVDGIRAHLAAPVDEHHHRVRFTENHDEPRAAATFGPAVRAAAVVVATVPGTTLWHEGQAEGHRVHLPVLLGRRPAEPDDGELAAFHHRLWAAAPQVRRGDFALAATSGWPGDDRHRQLLAWQWSDGEHVALVVVNLAAGPAAGRVHLRADAPAGATWRFTDPVHGVGFDRAVDEIAADGLFVDLAPWASHVLVADVPDGAQDGEQAPPG